MYTTGFYVWFVVLKVFIFYSFSFRLSIFLKIKQIECSLIPEQIGFGGKRCKILFVKFLGKPAGNILNNDNNR